MLMLPGKKVYDDVSALSVSSFHSPTTNNRTDKRNLPVKEVTGQQLHLCTKVHQVSVL
mgnify:CR=1 FL=1